MINLIERHSIKIQVVTFIAVVIFAISASYKVGQVKAEADARLCAAEAAISSLKDQNNSMHETFKIGLDECEENNHSMDVELAGINTKLANIENIQMEIKAVLKDMR